MVKPASEFHREALPTAYDPRAVEQRRYEVWERAGYFRGEIDPNREPFCIVMPPPNVTGRLHIGHALDNTLQDILIRWHRMRGDATLWQPGTDHAGIATQAVVERRLREEGLTRHELGRERFLERVWAWKDEYEANIVEQLKRLGASADWSRLRFTMDEGLSRAVAEVFVRYYERGLIYRGDYIVNWCPECRTAISDLEVNHEEEQGHLWTVRYPVVGGGEIRVATTRPETMLGDTAVAVHPEDERYRHLVGREAELPLVGRRIPIVADEAVDREFGTGAVKVTPFHDPTDFEIGQRHGLPAIQVIGEDGRMTAQAGEAYAGLAREEARKRVVADLERGGFLVAVTPLTHAVGHCDRCDTVVEPLVSRQWFLRMKPLAEPAIRAVTEGRIRIVPERFTRVYLHWMENIRDWCISRQLWWGHRIPAFTCQSCGELQVAVDRPERCRKCGAPGDRLAQDEDVLDTWFSSALWPFSTLGWPDDTPELRYFYPTSVLVTGYDILFFWVARMIMSGLAFMGDVPFRTVVLHGLVRDGEGRKMSKSRGNVVDPMDVIEAYGADVLRFTLIAGNAPGNDQRFSDERVEASRNFANKIWNAARFALLNLEGFDPGPARAWLEAGLREDDRPAGHAPAEVADRWILHRLNQACADCDRFLGRFEFGEAARTLYDFIWSEFCDWYLEAVKPRLYGREGEDARRTAQLVLWAVLERALRLLHPMMPFITDELWTHLPGTGESAMVAEYPRPVDAWWDEDSAEAMELTKDVVRAVRNLRTEAGVEPGRDVRVVIVAGDAERLLRLGDRYLRLARVSEWSFAGEPPAEPASSAVARAVQVFLPLRGLLDVARERERLEKARAEARAQLERVEARLAKPGYREKAPAEVVARDEQRAAELRETLRALDERETQLRALE
ncbi:MAG: valine--tRNA ligase [Clostridia bacterium]|nr:valine--tRNA ligase [Clostridia bacterium]